MKNKLFSFQVFAQPSVNGNCLMFKHAKRILLLFVIAIALGQTNLMAAKIVNPQADLAAQYEGWTFHGEATISPAVSGYSVTNIMLVCGGQGGFEHAQLQASIDDEGAILFVTLTNVSVSELPANVTLGFVTISNGDEERVFVVRTDGGNHIATEEDF